MVQFQLKVCCVLKSQNKSFWWAEEKNVTKLEWRTCLYGKASIFGLKIVLQKHSIYVFSMSLKGRM